MRILVTGAKGQLGSDVQLCLQKREIEVIGADRAEFDITDREAAKRYINLIKPDGIIHCSAYTAVDKAEEEKELCYQVNVNGTENIALICKEMDIKMLYVSTDYVFDGEKKGLYEISDNPNPRSVYGQTKLEGENAVIKHLTRCFIVRISWVFGENGSNFVKTMLRLAKEKGEVNVVCDQTGSPTYTPDLASLLCDMIVTEKYGFYHGTNEGFCTWAEFAKEIFRLSGLKTKVHEITTAEYITKAVRPKNSKMSKSSLDQNGFNRLPSWEDALKRYL